MSKKHQHKPAEQAAETELEQQDLPKAEEPEVKPEEVKPEEPKDTGVVLGNIFQM